jgi:regulatory protein
VNTGRKDPPPTGRISALEAQKRRRDRVSVFVDGEFALSLQADVALRAGLRVGDQLDAAALARLLQLEERESARGRALRFLETRERTSLEVESRLTRYGYEPQVVGGVMSWLKDLGYLDDDRFAREFAREKLAGSWGAGRVASELGRKGVGSEAIADAVAAAEEASGGSEVERLACVVRRRFARDLERDPVGARRRATGFMARRGYDWEQIRRVLAVVDEMGGEGTHGLEEP